MQDKETRRIRVVSVKNLDEEENDQYDQVI